jgi:hypothetical protein
VDAIVHCRSGRRCCRVHTANSCLYTHAKYADAAESHIAALCTAAAPVYRVSHTYHMIPLLLLLLLLLLLSIVRAVLIAIVRSLSLVDTAHTQVRSCLQGMLTVTVGVH